MPLEEIEGPDVPLEGREDDPDFTEIDPEQIPLSQLPQTGIVSMIWVYALGLAASLGGAGVTSVTILRRRIKK